MNSPHSLHERNIYTHTKTIDRNLVPHSKAELYSVFLLSVRPPSLLHYHRVIGVNIKKKRKRHVPAALENIATVHRVNR